LKSEILLFALLLTLHSSLNAQWSIRETYNESFRQKEFYAILGFIQPSPALNHPYQNTKYGITVGCRNEMFWVYMYFSTVPKISNTVLKDHSYSFSTTVYFGSEARNWQMAQQFDTNTIDLIKPTEFLDYMGFVDFITVMLNWENNPNRPFIIDIRGFRVVGKELYRRCRI